MTIKTLSISVIIGTVLAMLTLPIDWLLFGETSPYRQYFLYNVGLPNFWRMLNFPVFMCMLLSGARSNTAALFFNFMQWFLIGSLGYIVIRWMFTPFPKADANVDERIPPSERLR